MFCIDIITEGMTVCIADEAQQEKKRELTEEEKDLTIGRHPEQFESNEEEEDKNHYVDVAFKNDRLGLLGMVPVFVSREAAQAFINYTVMQQGPQGAQYQNARIINMTGVEIPTFELPPFQLPKGPRRKG